MHPNESGVRLLRIGSCTSAKLVEFLLRGDSILNLGTATTATDETRFAQVTQDTSNVLLFIVFEVFENLGPSGRGYTREEAVDRSPKRDSARGRGLTQPLDLLLVGAQSQAKHVGNHLLAEPLALELSHQSEEDLVCYMGQR